MAKNKKDKPNDINLSSNKEDFEVKLNSKLDDNTELVTTSDLSKQWLETSVLNFNNNYNQYSAILKESAIGSTLITDEELTNLAINTQSDLNKVKRINDIARYYINKDDLIGKVYETIESNVNTEIKLSFKDLSKNRNKQVQLEKAKELIDDFNEQINIKGLLRQCVPITYSEGNHMLYLRNNNGNYTVDSYPLGVIEVADYSLAGEPYILLNIIELRNRLQKVNKKSKSGKALFFEDIDDEIKNNYPPEVYKAHKNNEQYCKLDIKHSGILRINNMNRKYGVTPIFRTFKPASILDTFEQTDKINAKSKGKKIILQTLRKEILGEDASNSAFEEMSYAHDAFMRSWKASDVMVYTAPAFVESVQYIEPKVEGIPIDSVHYYRSKILTNLGISFLNADNKGAYAVADISIKELMKMINKITEQLEEILKKWYKVVLQANGIDLSFCPNVQVIDSEMLESEIKLAMVEILYSKLNCSLETAYNLMGIDIEDEAMRRKSEESKNYENIFKPRLTAYTNNGESPKTTTDTKGGRPTTKDPAKKDKSLQEQNKRGTL